MSGEQSNVSRPKNYTEGDESKKGKSSSASEATRGAACQDPRLVTSVETGEGATGVRSKSEAASASGSAADHLPDACISEAAEAYAKCDACDDDERYGILWSAAVSADETSASVPPPCHDSSISCESVLSNRLVNIVGFSTNTGKDCEPHVMKDLVDLIHAVEMKPAKDDTRKGLSKAWWRLKDFKLSAEEFGATLDQMSVLEQRSPICGVSHSVKSQADVAPWKMEESGRFNLSSIPDDNIVLLLDSVMLTPMEIVEDRRVQHKKLMVDEYNRTGRNIKYTKAQDDYIKDNMPMGSMLLGHVIDSIALIYGKVLHHRIAQSGVTNKWVLKRGAINSVYFRFNLAGMINFNIAEGSEKTFRFKVNNQKVLSDVKMCLSAFGHSIHMNASELNLILEGEVNLSRTEMLSAVSRTLGSHLEVALPKDDIDDISDVVMDELIGDPEALINADVNGYIDYNIVDVAPLLSLSNMSPPLDDKGSMVKYFNASERYLAGEFCYFGNGFSTKRSRRWFCKSLAQAIALSSSSSSLEEAKRFVVQFMVCANIENSIYSIDFSARREGFWPSERLSGEGLPVASMNMWLASRLFGIDDVYKIGFKYVVDAIIYNVIMTGKPCVRVYKLSLWFCHLLSFKSDFEQEANGVIERLTKYGVGLNVADVNRLLNAEGVVPVFELIVKAVKDWLSGFASRKIGIEPLASNRLSTFEAVRLKLGVTDRSLVSDMIPSEIVRMVCEGLDRETSQKRLPESTKALIKLNIKHEIRAIVTEIAEDMTYPELIDDRCMDFLLRKNDLMKRNRNYYEINEEPDDYVSVALGEPVRKVNCTNPSDVADRFRDLYAFVDRLDALSGSDVVRARERQASFLQSTRGSLGKMGSEQVIITETTLNRSDASAADYDMSFGGTKLANIKVGSTLESASNSGDRKEAYMAKLTLLEGFNASVGISFGLDRVRVANAVKKLVESKGLSSNYSFKMLGTVTGAVNADESGFSGSAVSGCCLVRSSDDISARRLWNDMRSFSDVLEADSEYAGVLEKVYFAVALAPSIQFYESVVLSRYLLDVIRVFYNASFGCFDSARQRIRGNGFCNSRVTRATREIAEGAVVTVQAALAYPAYKSLKLGEMIHAIVECYSAAAIIVNVNVAGGIAVAASKVMKVILRISSSVGSILSYVPKKLYKLLATVIKCIASRARSLRKKLSRLFYRRPGDDGTEHKLVNTGKENNRYTRTVSMIKLLSAGVIRLVTKTALLACRGCSVVKISTTRIVEALIVLTLRQMRTSLLISNAMICAIKRNISRRIAVGGAVSLAILLIMYTNGSLQHWYYKVTSSIAEKINALTILTLLVFNEMPDIVALAVFMQDGMVEVFNVNGVTRHMILLLEKVKIVNMGPISGALAEVMMSPIYLAVGAGGYLLRSIYYAAGRSDQWTKRVASLRIELECLSDGSENEYADAVEGIVSEEEPATNEDDTKYTFLGAMRKAQYLVDIGGGRSLTLEEQELATLIEKRLETEEGTLERIQAELALAARRPLSDSDDDARSLGSDTCSSGSTIYMANAEQPSTSTPVTKDQPMSSVNNGTKQEPLLRRGFLNSPKSGDATLKAVRTGLDVRGALFRGVLDKARWCINYVMAEKKELEKKKNMASRVTGVKKKNDREEEFSRVARLINEDDGSNVNNIMLDNWRSVVNGYEITDIKCDGINVHTEVTIASNDKLVLHSNALSCVTLGLSNNLDVIDLDCSSVVCMPSKGPVMMPAKVLVKRDIRHKYENSDWASASKRVVTAACPSAWRGYITGKMTTLVSNGRERIEAMVLPAHVWGYGLNDIYSSQRDELVTLAVVDEGSKVYKIGTEEESDIYDLEGKLPVVAHDIYQTSSSRYVMVTADCVSWQGCSGGPVVDRAGRYIGLLMMQLMTNIGYEVVDNCAVLIVATEVNVIKPLISMVDVKVVACPACSSVIRESAKISRVDRNELSGAAGTSEMASADDGPSKKERKLKDGLFNKLSDFVKNSLGCSTESELADEIVCKRTGALKESVETITAKDEKKSRDDTVGNRQSLDNLATLASITNGHKMSELTIRLLNSVILANVRGDDLLIILAEPAAALAFGSVLAACKTRFSFLKTSAKYITVMKSKLERNSHVYLLLVEDLISWFQLGELRSAYPSRRDIMTLLVRPDDEIDSKLSTIALTMNFLHNREVAVINYSGSTHEDRMFSFGDDNLDLYATSSRKFPLKNNGLVVSAKITNVITNAMDLDATTFARSEAMISCAAVTFSHSPVEMDRVRDIVARDLEVSKSSVMACHISHAASPAVWKILRTCSNVAWYTGTTSDYRKDISVNIKLVRAISDAVGSMLLDSIRAAAVMNKDKEIYSFLTCRLNALGEKVRPFSVNHPVLETTVRNCSTANSSTILDLTHKLQNQIVEGCLLCGNNNMFEENLARLTVVDSIKESIVKDHDLISDEIAMAKIIEESSLSVLWSYVTEVYKSFNVKLFEVEMWIVGLRAKVMESMQIGASRVLIRLRTKLMSIRRRVKRIIILGSRINQFRRTSMYKRQAGDDSWMRIIGRVAGVAYCAGSVALVNGRKLSLSSRRANLVLAAVTWATTEFLVTPADNIFTDVLKRVADLVAAFSWLSAAYALTNTGIIVLTWKNQAIRMDMSVVRSLCKDISNFIKAYMKSNGIKIVAERTGLMVYTGLSASLVHKISEGARILIDCCEIVYKFWFARSLESTLSSLWKGIVSRNETPRTSQGVLSAVPCVKYVEASEGFLMFILGANLAIAFSRWKANNDASAIGVLTDKKHAADVIEIYCRDRSSFVMMARCATLTAAIGLLGAGTGTLASALGLLCSGLLCLEVMSSSKTSSGFFHGLSASVARVAWSDRKFMTALVCLTRLFTGTDVAGLGMNVIIATGKQRNSATEMFTDNVLVKRLYSLCKEEQEKERIANANLMDFTTPPDVAYNISKGVLGLNGHEIEDFSNKQRWDMDWHEFDQIVDFNKITAEGFRYDEQKLQGSVRYMAKITTNQCRYMGRCRKILSRKRDDFADNIESVGQTSVYFLDNRIWEELIDEHQKSDWAAAKDGRFDVLLAIIERNDVKPFFEVSGWLMHKACAAALETSKKITGSGLRMIANDGPLDWWSVVSNVNEKSTAGIIARMRGNTKLAASFLGNCPTHCDAAKEMLLLGLDKNESHVINVFAKRRIEKKKSCKITGDTAVITRTIQANEIEMKMAVMEAFLVQDKMLKLTRYDTGVCIGMNFFTEYCEDEARNYLATMTSEQDRHRTVRVSLDHSSFDSSQRNWSIRLIQEMRKTLLDEICVDDSNALRMRQYLDNCYKRLKIRSMLTAAGDVFAVTGQQMSGHATTSSDNSLKSLIYAKIVTSMLEDEGIAKLKADSLRVQGDDTKFDLVMLGDWTDNDLPLEIEEKMARLGQNVKYDKIKITDWNEPCDFLSHYAETNAYMMTDGSRKWMEIHWTPMRDREEIFAMCATTLKHGKTNLPKKTPKDIALMGAKAISFAIMYGTDYWSAYLCSTICWAASKLLSGMRGASANQDINVEWLPWLVSQSGLSGEFQLDFKKIFVMHSISRETLRAEAAEWIILWGDQSSKFRQRIIKLQHNFCRAFPRLKGWQWEKLNEAFRLTKSENWTSIVSASVENASIAMRGSYLNKVNIKTLEVGYEPLMRLKRKIKLGMAAELSSKGPVSRVYIYDSKPGTGMEDEIVARSILALEKAENVEAFDADYGTSDGIVITAHNYVRFRVEGTNEQVWIVPTIYDALMLEAKVWDIFEVSAVKRNCIELGAELLSNAMHVSGEAMIIDERRSREVSADAVDTWMGLGSKRHLTEMGLKTRREMMLKSVTNFKKIIIVFI